MAAAAADGKETPGFRGRQALSWYHLVGVTFFAVCGGDYGLEDSVGAAGPALSLAGLMLLPWVWSLPIALMTAELGSMIPETGGYVVWVHRGFGPFWAHLNALWNLVSNTFDNALYPVMFVDYLHYFPALRLEGLKRWLLSLTMLTSAAPSHAKGCLMPVPPRVAAARVSPAPSSLSAGLLLWPPLMAPPTTAAKLSLPRPFLQLRGSASLPPTTCRSVTSLNLLGVDVVASASNVFAVLVISPFAALVVAGLPQLKPSTWLLGPPPDGVRHSS